MVGYFFVLKNFDDFWDFPVGEQLTGLQEHESDRFVLLLAHCMIVNAHSFRTNVHFDVGFFPCVFAVIFSFLIAN